MALDIDLGQAEECPAAPSGAAARQCDLPDAPSTWPRRQMDYEAIMIMAADGLCWLQTWDSQGRQRLSYCGEIGTADRVKAFCDANGIEFRQMSPPRRRPGHHRSKDS